MAFTSSSRRLDRLVIVVAVVGLAILLAIPVFRAPPLVDDSFWIDYVWAGRFTAELRGGTIYPRWLSGSFDGLGAPVFYFYAPLAFYGVALAMLAGLATYPALLATFVAFHAGSGLAMHIWLKTLDGQRWPALAGALLYMALPYHLIDFNRRGALAEFAAFAIIPLVAIGIRRALQGRGPLVLALSYAALVVTHLPTALLVSVLLIPPLALRSGVVSRLWIVAVALLLGIGLAAIYLIPALTLQDHSKIGLLWASYGFSPDVWNLLRPDRWPSASSGTVFGLVIVANAVTAACLIRRRAWFWPVVAIVNCLVAGALIPGFWSLPLMAKVQFPWRALSIVEFAVATALAEYLATTAHKGWRLLGLVPALCISLSIVALPFPVGHPTLQELDRERPDVPEYLPVTGPIRTSKEAVALARAMPDGYLQNGVTIRRRFWFPNVEVRCAGRVVTSFPDPATGRVAYRGTPDCRITTVPTRAERFGLIVSLLAAGLVALLLLRTALLGRPARPGLASLQ